MIKPLKRSSKIKYWSDAFAHSFSDADILGGVPSEWFLVSVGEVKKSRNNLHALNLFLRRNDGMEGRKYIRSEDNAFLEKLAIQLADYVRKSWKEIGNIKVVEE